jgi:hypothetical protein
MQKLAAKGAGPFRRFLGIDALEPTGRSGGIGEVLRPPLLHRFCGDR